MASFDTPTSGTAYPIQVTGTIDGYNVGHGRVTVRVTGTGPTRNEAFYTVVNIPNTSSLPLAFSQTYSIAIVPKVNAHQIVTVSPTISWVYDN